MKPVATDKTEGKPNYHRQLEQILEKLEAEGKRPSLLLHSCCAPCSSYVLEYLSPYFRITVYYYNPNITDREEYERRLEEQRRLIALYNKKSGRGEQISFLAGAYEPERFLEMSAGLEQLPEGGARCLKCYEMRLMETAETARREGFAYFATTLSISPHKNAVKLFEAGEKAAKVWGVRHLPADFKKKNGYRRSVELSAEYGLYRQDYCGCVYSKAQRGIK